MKKLVLLFLLSSSTVYAQRQFTIEETVFGPGQFAPKTLLGMQWATNSDTFTHLDPTYQQLLARSANSDWNEKVIAKLDDIKVALEKVLPSENSPYEVFLRIMNG